MIMNQRAAQNQAPAIDSSTMTTEHLAFAAAVPTWVALYGVNPIHLTTPTP